MNDKWITATQLAGGILATLRQHDYCRRIDEISDSRGAKVVVNGQEYLNFSSNDYLGLSSHQKVVEASVAALRRFGLGSGGSRLAAGTQTPHRQLEERIAEFQLAEDAVIFSTGYLANVGIIPALAGLTMKSVMETLAGEAYRQPEVEFIADQLVHASILDGMSLATAKFWRGAVKVSYYRHRDMQSLSQYLEASEAPVKVVITDGVFSFHGRIAPLLDIAVLAKRYGAEVYVDDAHGVGVYGNKGRGVAELMGVDKDIHFPVGTLSKAIGGAGGYVTGTKDVCDYFRVACRTHMFQTGMPPAIAAGLIESINLIEREPARREVLLKNADWLRNELHGMGFDTFNSETQIIPVFFGHEAGAKKAVKILLSEGIFAPCYCPPTVGKGQAMVRLSVTASHTRQHLETLLSALEKTKQEVLPIFREKEDEDRGI